MSLAAALTGARLACHGHAEPDPAGDSRRVRVCAARALWQAGLMRSGVAARACGVKSASQVTPVMLPACGVSPDMVEAVVDFMATGTMPPIFPETRYVKARSAARLARLDEARRLYESGLSLKAVGARLSPPVSLSAVYDLLTTSGVPMRGPGGARGRLVSPRRSPIMTQPRRPPHADHLAEVAPNVTRWSRAYAARGVPVSLLASLFEVDRRSLAWAVRR